MSRSSLPVLRVPLVGDGAPGHGAARAEWLVTNGIGGYASGTVTGETTRRYHGLLVAAFPNPLGRMVMLTALPEDLPPDCLEDFRLEGGIPVWRYALDDVEIEKRIAMPHRQNTVVVQYRLLRGERTTLRVTPVIDFRHYEEPVSEAVREDYTFAETEDGHVLSCEGVPPLRLRVEGSHRVIIDRAHRAEVLYAMEEARGYRGRGTLWSPGSLELDLCAGPGTCVVASTEDPDIWTALGGHEVFVAEAARKHRLIDALPHPLRDETGVQLALAAEQFVIAPVGRARDAARALASGDEVRTVIAGYHWFTDWGRDTMIALEGLTLATGRHREAGFILRTFAHYVRDGLIPNMFPNGSDEGLYHTADATLWFFHALERYTRVTGSLALVEEVLPVLRGIVDAHMRGTRFGIGMDDDALLRQGLEGYQLTWMDAKVDDWVVTPRRGKAVEINALWHNALCAMAGFETALGRPSDAKLHADIARRSRAAFNERFWNERSGFLFDVVDGPDGDDAACRPNQLFALSLPHPVLAEPRWAPVLAAVERELLTPLGLRSLSRDHPDYKRTYHGDLRSRDGAYHQGTVWGWLIGPFVDAWLKLHPSDAAGARRLLDGLIAHLPEFGVGSMAEIFDAEPPYTPRGCIAQAWSVAEVLRCYGLTAHT